VREYPKRYFHILIILSRVTAANQQRVFMAPLKRASPIIYKYSESNVQLMYRFFTTICISLLLILIIFGSFGIADETPTTLAYIQGGNVSIINDTNGQQEIVIEDVIPYLFHGTCEKGILVPIHLLTGYQRPFNAFLTFFTDKIIGGTMVKVEDLSIDETTKKLSLTTEPLEYYEGTLLKSYVNEIHEITPEQGDTVIITKIHLELPQKTPNNTQNQMKGGEACVEEGPGCGWCYDTHHEVMVECYG